MTQKYYLLRRPNNSAGGLMIFAGVALTVIGSALKWAWDLLYSAYSHIHSWESLPEPYSLAAAFYYYALVMPAEGGLFLWHEIHQLEVSIYPNVNLLLAVFGVITYLAIIYLAVRIMISVLVKLNINPAALLFALLLPALLASSWFLYELFSAWLFSLH